jgi:hypothetical protein
VRQTAVLRAAITQLLAGAPSPTKTRWAELRPREAGLTRAQLEQAVAGEAVDTAVVMRLSGFLTGDQGAASG